MFYDLNIKVSNPKFSADVLEGILDQLVNYGYRGVAITTEVNESIFISKKEKPKKNNILTPSDVLPPPISIDHLKQKFPKLNIYRRINIILSECENIRKVFQSKNIKRYDLISFQPENQYVLKSLAGFSDVDIISYNPESKCSLSITRKLYNKFVSQKVYLELMYAPAITSQSARRNLISLSHIYHSVGKSRNLIVCSGAYLAHHIRGPYDVINLNLLFGLSEEQAKKAISRHCEELLIHARKKRRGKIVVELMSNDVTMDYESDSAKTEADLKNSVMLHSCEEMEMDK